MDREIKSFQSKITELQILVDKLRKQVRERLGLRVIVRFGEVKSDCNQVKGAREGEVKAGEEMVRLREQLEKKSALVLRLREEKMGQGRAGSRARLRETGEEERDELRGQVCSCFYSCHCSQNLIF